ncbi:MAG TPA: HD domain-containing phosphohydrolase [Candidatus Dormibacteraeota bacterium]|nr:HD domain-containing phosphohydrolase [Candidatus Dormibacteraeota bacterium]
MRLPIRYKIIVPFAVLLVFVGVIGSGVATARLTDAAAAKFDADLLHSSLLANQSVAQVEAARLADLRLATDTVGVAESLAANDIDGLTRLLTPIAGNVTTASIQLRVLDVDGREVLRIQGSRNSSGPVAVLNPSEFATEPAVVKVLSGEPDPIAGDRRVFLSSPHAQPVLYWTGAVRTSGQRIVGAVLVGQSLAEIAKGIDGSAFYDRSGTLLASALASPPIASDAVRRQVTAQTTVRPTIDESHPGHAYWALFSTWTMRGSQFGYLAVQANADSLLSVVNQVRLILTLVFTAAALLTLLVGTATASRLTRPIEGLVRSMRAVSAGNLQHRASVTSKDEIGYLAQAFNEMTASLEEKTAALEETAFASMEALARAIDARDPSTFGHSARVAAVSIEIADEMQLPAKERESLRRAALLHDIGKIGVQDRVLRKPGPLNDAEMDEMREHSRIGHDMLQGLRFLRPSLPGILHHHERWDGGGYPSGISGTEIPLLVRIIAVADVFDALTSDRPYRQGLSFEAATAAIRHDAGMKFDPDVVSAFMARRPVIEALLRKMGKTVLSTQQTEAA